MAEQHAPKRMNTLSFKTTDDVLKALPGLAHLDDVSQSEYIHNAVKELVDRRKAEAILLNEALGIKIL